MPRFLTPEWIVAVNEAASLTPATSRPTGGPTLTLQQVVINGTGDLRYTVRIVDGSVSVTMGEDPDADVTITEDRATAEALSRGELPPQVAFMTGRVRVAGNVAVLMEHQSALHQLDAAFAALRAATTY